MGEMLTTLSEPQEMLKAVEFERLQVVCADHDQMMPYFAWRENLIRGQVARLEGVAPVVDTAVHHSFRETIVESLTRLSHALKLPTTHPV